MDLSDPTRSVTPSLDGPVLATLAKAGRPLTVGEVASQAVRGSEIGIRRSLSRLVEQGIVRATVMGRNRVHELNRDHVAAPVADLLAGLRVELWRRLRESLSQWQQPAVYACVFGSAARGDGGVESDIDLLLVHPPFPGERWPPGSTGLLDTVLDGLSAAAAQRQQRPLDPEVWQREVDELRGSVQKWTGNRLQVVDLDFYRWKKPTGETAVLLEEIKSINVEMVSWPRAIPGS